MLGVIHRADGLEYQAARAVGDLPPVGDVGETRLAPRPGGLPDHPLVGRVGDQHRAGVHQRRHARQVIRVVVGHQGVAQGFATGQGSQGLEPRLHAAHGPEGRHEIPELDEELVGGAFPDEMNPRRQGLDAEAPGVRAPDGFNLRQRRRSIGKLGERPAECRGIQV